MLICFASFVLACVSNGASIAGGFSLGSVHVVSRPGLQSLETLVCLFGDDKNPITGDCLIVSLRFFHFVIQLSRVCFMYLQSLCNLRKDSSSVDKTTQ